MPSDGLACYLEVYGIRMLMICPGHAQKGYMAAHGIEHDGMRIQFHLEFDIGCFCVVNSLT